MIWDEKKKKALELIVEKEHTHAEIAVIVGCARQTLYEWEKMEEFKAELTKCRQERNKRILDCGSDKLYVNYDTALDTIADNMKNGSPRNKLLAAIWWAEKIDGKPTTKHEISDSRDNKGEVSIDLLDEVMDEVGND